jgi:glycerophosphoryl diester phosphodiesterase
VRFDVLDERDEPACCLLERAGGMRGWHARSFVGGSALTRRIQHGTPAEAEVSRWLRRIDLGNGGELDAARWRHGVVRLLPHLGEALDAARGAAIDVELKVPPGITAAEAYRHGAQLVRQIARQPGVITSSFNPDAARGMLAEGATAGIIVESMPARGLLEELASNGLAWLFVQGTALREGVSATRNPEVRLGTWTLNDAAGLDAARRAGCDVVITDRPRLVAALQAAEAPR